MKTLTQIRHNRRYGFTLTEVVTVLAILTFLATLIVYVYNEKMKDARIAMAQAECKLLGQAEETVAMEFGFFVPLQVLNDRPVTFSGTYADRGNQIDQEPNTLYVIAANTSLTDQINNGQSTLGGYSQTGPSSNTDPRVVRMIRNWRGPYATFQRWYVPNNYSGPSDTNYLNNDTDRRRDFPLDPWGMPYFLYSPYGPTGYFPTGTAFTDNFMDNTTFSNGRLNNNINYKVNAQFAVVSWGPDGIMDHYQTDNRLKDDIYYYFGTLHD